MNLNLDHVYRMMDHLATQEEQIKQRVARVTQDWVKHKVDVLLLDVTTLNFENTELIACGNLALARTLNLIKLKWYVPW